MKWIDEVDGEFNGKPCKIKVGISNSYSESDVLELTKMVLNINEKSLVMIGCDLTPVYIKYFECYNENNTTIVRC